ncbi:hypothetical protein [Sphingomonas hankyongi]|uniref:Uncharacterized protein n=1 Tax=Sphingomonas hankyongi TaxID=2908209 RepID=A0ABT0S0L3_9SPHN|nr:hypothetical protein [Sphingomonas hankyongi]MCL6729193.1 hypothetical protein [Sphingomonas hankyongi]
MTELDSACWAALATRLAETHSDDHGQIADAIASIYAALAKTPVQILQGFREISEAELMDGIQERARRIVGGEIAITEGDDPHVTLLDAARLLRAFERVALEGRQFLETDRDEELEDLWRTADGLHYVIPRMTPLASAEGKPFLRRALIHHRVIPTGIESFKVRLHRSPFALDRADADKEKKGGARRYGAALFPGLVPKLSPPDGSGFTIVQLDGFNAETLIDQQLASARSDECAVIVWAELTMPDASVAHLQSQLKRSALDGEPALRYLVAGSWHRDSGGMRNAAAVLDGHGRLLFEVFKWAKFDFGGRFEAIVPGDEVHILICEDELVTVAICRDFLEGTCDVPYRRLDVDVAIVPSMISSVSERTTMAGHGVTADTMRNRFGTRTFAVAQPARPAKVVTGKVMAFPRQPLLAKPVTVKGPWYASTLEPS